MSQIGCPTPHIHTEIEPFTSCVITLVQYSTISTDTYIDILFHESEVGVV